MPKLEYLTAWRLFCPGCRSSHLIPDDGRWKCNGNFEQPSFVPSINEVVNPPTSRYYRPEYPTSRCHFIVTDGMIRYCGDCTHDLKNHTVPMEDVHAWDS
jgi:hypothetical protein